MRAYDSNLPDDWQHINDIEMDFVEDDYVDVTDDIDDTKINYDTTNHCNMYPNGNIGGRALL